MGRGKESNFSSFIFTAGGQSLTEGKGSSQMEVEPYYLDERANTRLYRLLIQLRISLYILWLNMRVFCTDLSLRAFYLY